MLLFSGNSNHLLANKIAKAMNTDLAQAVISRYSDGETRIEINHNVQGHDVCIIQSTCYPVNNNILELCLLANTLYSMGTRTITAMMPYFGYGRHDGNTDKNLCNAKLIMQLLATAHINTVQTLDLHSKRLQRFFDISNFKLINISSAQVFANISQIREVQDPVIVAPDMGGVARCQEFARALGYHNNNNLAIIDKQRYSKNKTLITTIIGNINNRDCIIVDDIIDTGNTLNSAAIALQAQGANRVYACCTHAVLSGNAVQSLQQSICEKIFVTDSIYPYKLSPKLSYVSVADLVAINI